MALFEKSAVVAQHVSAVRAASSDIDRVLHFTDQGVILGTAMFLAVIFMLWVLWSFWRESRR